MLLRMVGTGAFDVGITVPLALEYEAIGKRMADGSLFTEADVDAVVSYLCSVGKRRGIRWRLRPAVADPGDEMVLESAVATRSEWIVTHNVRDLSAGAARHGIETITPQDALRRLGAIR